MIKHLILFLLFVSIYAEAEMKFYNDSVFENESSLKVSEEYCLHPIKDSLKSRRLKFDSKYEIEPLLPIVAEYCLYIIDDSLERHPKRLRKLDTITKIYPYKYEEARNCDWGSVFFSRRTELGKGYELGEGFPPFRGSFRSSFSTTSNANSNRERNKGKDPDFYLYLPISFDDDIVLDSRDLNRIKIDSGIVSIDWELSVMCNEKYTNLFSGKYDIRITGECDSAKTRWFEK